MSEAPEAGCYGGAPLIQSVTPAPHLPPGPQLTQVSVLQYGSITNIDVSWSVHMDRDHLLRLVDPMQREGGPSLVGNVGSGLAAGDAACSPCSWHK